MQMINPHWTDEPFIWHVKNGPARVLVVKRASSL